MITVDICETPSDCFTRPSCTGCIGKMYPEKCLYPGKRKSQGA